MNNGTRLGGMALLLLSGVVVLAGPATSPYVGEQGRSIKALAPEDVDGYLAGRGMGLARAAELNHYPGPMHVLGMADELGLTPDQRERVQSAYDRMRAEAKAAGALLVEKERELDAAFATGRADEGTVERLTAEAAALAARVRFAHLKAHVSMRAILTEAQVARYDELRGYQRDQDDRKPARSR